MIKQPSWKPVLLTVLVAGVAIGILGSPALAVAQAQEQTQVQVQTLVRQVTVLDVLDPFLLSPVQVIAVSPASQVSSDVMSVDSSSARQAIRIPPRLPERSAFRPSIDLY